MRLKIHLDHAAATSLDRRVLEAMAPGFEYFSANPSGVYDTARMAANTWRTSKERISKLLGCKRNQVIFTSGGTEANNLGLIGFLQTQEPGHILANPGEHASVRLPLIKWAEQKGWDLDWLPVDQYGRVDVSRTGGLIRKNTRLIAVQWASNETGVLQPIAELGLLAKTAKVTFFCDAVQAGLTELLNPAEVGVDLMTLSAHKFYGPKGIGLLYKRDGIDLQPIMLGGGQEQGLRPGTENLPGALGMARALELSVAERFERQEHFKRLSGLLYEGLEDAGSPLVPFDIPRVQHIQSFLFEGHRAQGLLMQLDLLGIEASSGSACSVGMEEPSAGMLAMGLKPEQALCTLRFSFGLENTETEIMQVIEHLWEILGSD